MNKRLLFIISGVVLLMVASCSKNNTEPKLPEFKVSYKVTSHNTISKTVFLDSLKNSFTSEEVAAQYASKVPDDMTFESYNIEYVGKDENDKDITLSGIVIIPKVGGKFTASGIIISNRATQLSEDGVPSNKWNGGTIFAADNYVLASSDLIGYGASIDRPVNYNCWHLAGRNTLLAAIVAQQMVHDKTYVSETVNEKLGVYNTGYSQGGYSALAVHRYWETEAPEEEKAMAPLIKSYCGAGPYSLGIMMDYHFEKGRSMFAPYIVAGFLSAIAYHPAAFKNHSVNDFLTQEAIEAGVVDLLNSKQIGNMDMIGLYLLTFADEQTLSTMDIDLRRVFNEETLSKDGALHKIALEGCNEECVYKGWTPSKKPIHFYHAESDTCVPCECTRAVVSEYAGNNLISVEYGNLPVSPTVHLAAEKVFYTQMLSVFP